MSNATSNEHAESRPSTPPPTERPSIYDLEEQVQEIFNGLGSEDSSFNVDDPSSPVCLGEKLPVLFQRFAEKTGKAFLDEQEMKSVVEFSTSHPDVPVTSDLLMAFLSMQNTRKGAESYESPPKSRETVRKLYPEEEEEDDDDDDDNDAALVNESLYSPILTQQQEPSPPPSCLKDEHDLSFDGKSTIHTDYDNSQQEEEEEQSILSTQPPYDESNSSFNSGHTSLFGSPIATTISNTNTNTDSPLAARRRSTPLAKRAQSRHMIHDTSLTSPRSDHSSPNTTQVDSTSFHPLPMSPKEEEPLFSNEMSQSISQENLRGSVSNEYLGESFGANADTGGGLSFKIESLPSLNPTNLSEHEISALIRSLQDSTRKYRELERIHQLATESSEMTIADLQTRIEDLQNDLASKRKEEKELRQKEKQYLEQIAALEQEVNQVTKSLEKQRELYNLIKKQYEEQCHESEKLRDTIRARELDISSAEENAQNLAQEASNWERDRTRLENAIATLKTEVEQARELEGTLQEKEQENFSLKETIDRLRFDIDGLRSHAKALETGNSNTSTSQADNSMGSLSRNLGREIAGSMDDSFSENHGASNTSQTSHLIKSIQNDSSNNDADENYIEQVFVTRTRRIKAPRKQQQQQQQGEAQIQQIFSPDNSFSQDNDIDANVAEENEDEEEEYDDQVVSINNTIPNRKTFIHTIETADAEVQCDPIPSTSIGIQVETTETNNADINVDVGTETKDSNEKEEEKERKNKPSISNNESAVEVDDQDSITKKQIELAKSLGLEVEAIKQYAKTLTESHPPNGTEVPPPPYSTVRQPFAWNNVPAASTIINIIQPNADSSINLRSPTVTAFIYAIIFLTGVLSVNIYSSQNYQNFTPVPSDRALWAAYNTFPTEGFHPGTVGSQGGFRDSIMFWVRKLIWSGVHVALRVPT